MISLNCTKCRERLEMDDGFAGGVCRCQFCGTIQTVPSRAKPKVGAKPAKAPAGKTRSPGSGLDELAEIVASSGLARGALTKPARGAAKPETPPAKPGVKSNPMMPLLIGAGVIVVALIGVVIYLLGRPTAAPPAGAGQTAKSGAVSSAPGKDGGPDRPAPIAGPAFADVPLPSGAVVYVLDQSQANDDFLDAVKAVTYQSVRSRGPSRQFQIIFWKRDEEPIMAYPEAGLASATPAEVE